MPKVSLKDFFLKFVSVVDKGDNKGANILLFKSEPEPEAVQEENDITKGGDVIIMKTLEEILKGLSEEDAKVVSDEIEKAKTPKAEEGKEDKAGGTASFDDVNDVRKSADPAVQALVAKADADAILIKELQDNIKKDKLEKTVAQFDKISAPKEDLMTVFKAVDDVTATTIETILKAVNAQLSESTIIKVIGSDGEKSEEKAIDMVEKGAEEIKKAEGITIEQARVKFLQKNKGLYTQYQDEMKGV